MPRYHVQIEGEHHDWEGEAESMEDAISQAVDCWEIDEDGNMILPDEQDNEE